LTANAAAGDPIVQSQCGSAPDQLWTLDGTSSASVLHNVANRLCLDVQQGSLANGAKPIVWTCNGGANQTLRYVSPTTE
jgi:hypothetical protein